MVTMTRPDQTTWPGFDWREALRCHPRLTSGPRRRPVKRTAKDCDRSLLLARRAEAEMFPGGLALFRADNDDSGFRSFARQSIKSRGNLA